MLTTIPLLGIVVVLAVLWSMSPWLAIGAIVSLVWIGIGYYLMGF